MILRLALVLSLLSPLVALAADPAPAPADGTTQPAKKKVAKKKADGKKPDKKQ